ncbi:MAG: type II toxin-antitoxin system RelE/ParE family toxin [Bdellovibrionota bacterium]
MTTKPLVWLNSEIKTPPFSKKARLKAGFLLRELQSGVSLSMPDSRQMSVVGKSCHEIRIRDSSAGKTWRIIYRVDFDAIVIAEIFAKQTQKTPKKNIDNARKRLAEYDNLTEVKNEKE